MEYGECLVGFLNEYGWKRAQLVKALGMRGIDPSLARRWLRGERVPKLSSGYHERIVECLGLSAVDGERLREAQINSLQGYGQIPSAAPVPRAGGTGPGGNKALAETPPRAGSLSRLPLVDMLASQAIHGRIDVLQSAIILLESAALIPPGDVREILLTFQVGEAFGDSASGVALFTAALRETLDRGYHLLQLVQPDADPRRSTHVVESTLGLVERFWSYEPRHFTRHWAHAWGHELLIVPGVGALIGFATEREGLIDVALILGSPRQVEILRAHFGGLLAQTLPLLNSYPLGADQGRFLDVLARAEEKEGDLLLWSDGLSPHTEPLSWYVGTPDLTPGGRGPVVGPPPETSSRRRRLEAFYRQVESRRFREICPRSALVRFVTEGEGIPSSPRDRLAPEHRVEQLENTIAILNSFDNYELALAGEAEGGAHPAISFWGVKWDLRGSPSVMLEGWPLVHGARQGVGAEILEPGICGSFRHHFLDLFDNRLSPASKDRREVKQFLQAQADWLRDRIRGRRG